MDTVVLIINVFAICVYVTLKAVQYKIHKKYALREPLRSLVIRNAVHNGAQLGLGLIIRPQFYFSVRCFSITSSPNTWIPLPPQLLHLLLCIHFGVIAIRPITHLVNYQKQKIFYDHKTFWKFFGILITTAVVLIQMLIAYAEWDYEEPGVISVAKIGVGEVTQMILALGVMFVNLCFACCDSPIDNNFRPNIQQSEMATLRAYFNAVKWQKYITTISIFVPVGISIVSDGLGIGDHCYWCSEISKSLLLFTMVLAPVFEEIVVMWIGRKDSRSNIVKVTVIGEREEDGNGWIKKVIGFIITTMMARRHVYIHRG